MLSKKVLKGNVTNLKGRISKYLTWTKGLQEREVYNLGELFRTLDEIILYEGDMPEAKVDYFKNNLKDYTVSIKSDKSYVKKHILPIIDRMLEQEWI